MTKTNKNLQIGQESAGNSDNNLKAFKNEIKLGKILLDLPAPLVSA
eukprot:CAMPEP_0170548018 /NCGR_PEP_ID=MMETSP0211-20121228/6329_1 /TAXON_ID=311385 /ORGANISM="Pseudokeronopsis sp., Strain OXSARD2" /LENGTH=45 /DNA_ID= /DNA_START= /DNA_END= /DNA_ORIENTATION=